MSNSSELAYADLDKLNFTGGFPTSKDLAPSIIFLVVVSLFTSHRETAPLITVRRAPAAAALAAGQARTPRMDLVPALYIRLGPAGDVRSPRVDVKEYVRGERAE